MTSIVSCLDEAIAAGAQFEDRVVVRAPLPRANRKAQVPKAFA